MGLRLVNKMLVWNIRYVLLDLFLWLEISWLDGKVMDYFNKVKLELKFLLCLMEIKMSVYIIGYG